MMWRILLKDGYAVPQNKMEADLKGKKLAKISTPTTPYCVVRCDASIPLHSEDEDVEEFYAHDFVRNCDGGHICHPPKECCKQGCCYPQEFPVSRSGIVVPTPNMFTPLFVGHWYFWAAITATLAGILCACSLWRRHSSGSFFCCRDSGRDERASEPDSNGSCYVPPQYSRCSSFHQAPPPYSEVASKPDLYPLVISYNGDAVVKTNGTSTGYLMVQYFRNFIVRPVVVGSLSATSTIDSLSSSFICNATNEANTIIPPPYSCMGSLEEMNPMNASTTGDPAMGSSPSPTDHPRSSPSVHSSVPSIVGPLKSEMLSEQPPGDTTSQRSDVPSAINPLSRVGRKLNFNVFTKNHSVDSESDEHNFSDLLNLSVCVPSSVTHLASGTQSNPQMDMIQSYSVTNSMTSSDISSLANLGTPDSPPRATSPTVEMRELLDKIQQLPQHKSPLPEADSGPKVKTYFNRSKAKTLYMPLHVGSSQQSQAAGSRPGGLFGKTTRGWLSRSAPNTPCGTFVPAFPSQKKTGSQRGSKSKIYDGSPLLREHDESDEEPQKDECL